MFVFVFVMVTVLVVMMMMVMVVVVVVAVRVGEMHVELHAVDAGLLLATGVEVITVESEFLQFSH